MLPVVILLRAPWPSWRQTGHIAIAGALFQFGYLGGVWEAIKLGMPAGLSSLIVGLQPILTAVLASLVAEHVTRRQWLGLLLGITGVAMVLFEKISVDGLTRASIAFIIVGLFSITLGTLYQKRFCPSFDLRTGSIVQFATSAALRMLAWTLLRRVPEEGAWRTRDLMNVTRLRRISVSRPPLRWPGRRR